MPAPRTRPETAHDDQGEKMTVDERLNTIDQRLSAILHELQGRNEDVTPALLGTSTQDKVTRRRSLDEMQAALRRLLSPEPRPRDDESPQVIQDAITELILHRQLVADLMQSMTSGYQHGLDAIRKMTER